MALWLIRHTQVAIEPGICYGQSDVSLKDSWPNDFAKVQQKVISSESPLMVYCSPLQRCRRLAEFLTEQNQWINPINDQRLLELNFGDWEKKSWDWIYSCKEGKIWFDDYLNASCPGGESYRDLEERVSDFWTAIQPMLKRHSVIVVSHAGPLRLLAGFVQKLSAEESMGQVFPCGAVLAYEYPNSFADS